MVFPAEAPQLVTNKPPEVEPSRSAQMALVKARDTRPEMRVRRALHKAGLRYRLHEGGLPGHPDLVLPSRRLTIFVHGCFWHRHLGCKRCRLPKSRLDYWLPKFEANVARDQRVRGELERAGWSVLIVWECETLDTEKIQSLVALAKSFPSSAQSSVR